MSPLCARAQSFLDGRLSADEAAEVERHWPGCATCRPLVEAWRAVGRYGAELGQPPTDAQVQRLLVRAREPVAAAAWWPRLAIGLVAAAAAVAALVWWQRPVAEAPAKPIAVKLELPGGSLAALEGDVVETTAAKTSVIELGGDRIGVARTSRVRVLQRDSRTVRLKLERGAVAVAAAHRQPGQRLVVEAGGAEVTVVGTQFRVSLEGAGPRVEVLEGRVRVKTAAGEQLVLPGQAFENGAVVPFAAEGFSELEAPKAEVAAPEAEADGGEATETDTDEGVPAVASKSAPSAEARERFRQAALEGRCESLKAGLGSWPRDAQLWQLSGDCARLGHRDDEAVRAYRRAVALATGVDAQRSRILLADGLERLGRHAEAEQALKTYLKRPPTPELEAAARVKLARALAAQHRNAEARRELEQVTSRLSSTPAAVEALELMKKLKP